MEPPSSNLTDTSFLADPASEDPLAANLYDIPLPKAGTFVPGGFFRV